MEIDFRIPPESARVDVPWAVIVKIKAELRTPYEPDERLALLTPGQRAIYALQLVTGEIYNGGFFQCFWNSTGFLIPEAIEGVDVLGAPRWPGLLCRARDLLPLPYPRDRPTRQESLLGLSQEQSAVMSQLDDEMYRLENEPTTNLDQIFERYIERNPDEFFVGRGR